MNITENNIENKDELREVVFVYVQEGELVTIREVETGIQDNQFIEIISGLTEEEEVVV